MAQPGRRALRPPSPSVTRSGASRAPLLRFLSSPLASPLVMVKGKGKEKGGGGSYGPHRHRGSWNPSGPYAVTWDGTIPGPGASWGHHSGGDGSWEAGGGSPTSHPPPGVPPGGGSSWTAGEESSGDASGRWVWYDYEHGLDYSNIGQEFLSGSRTSVTQLVLCSEWQDGHGPGFPITPEQITGSLPGCM